MYPEKKVDLHYLNTQIIFSITLHGGYLKVLDPLIQGFIVLWKHKVTFKTQKPHDLLNRTHSECLQLLISDRSGKTNSSLLDHFNLNLTDSWKKYTKKCILYLDQKHTRGQYKSPATKIVLVLQMSSSIASLGVTKRPVIKLFRLPWSDLTWSDQTHFNESVLTSVEYSAVSELISVMSFCTMIF